MKPVNPQKERIIFLVNQLLARAGLSIDQIVARMQVAGCQITRSTFENRFTTRVHQKPNISAQWLLALVHACTDQLSVEERCQAGEAVELAQLTSLPIDQFALLRQFFTEADFAQALERFAASSYFSIKQNTTLAVNLLTKDVNQKAQIVPQGTTARPTTTSTPERLNADWGEAPDVAAFLDRVTETQTIERWIVNENCRLVGIFGMGGIGKTMLAAQVVHTVQQRFDRIFWRSLRNTPSLDELLADLLDFLLGAEAVSRPTTPERRLLLVTQQLRTQHCLLVLDNCEALVEAENSAGNYRMGYEITLIGCDNWRKLAIAVAYCWWAVKNQSHLRH